MPRHQTRGRSLNRGGPRRRTVNKRRALSVNSNNKVKNEEIGSGGFGVVSRPPQMCGRYISNEKNFNADAFREVYLGNPDYISKITELSGAEIELDIGNRIKELMPDYDNYFCLIEFICGAPESKSFERNGDFYGTYAIAPYCGVPLSKLIERNIPPPVSVFELCFLVTALQHLTRAINRLHTHHIYHQDIHLDNILWDTDTGLMRLIDFGLAQYPEGMGNNDPVILNLELTDCEKLIDNVIKPVVTYVLQSDILETARRRYSYIDDFYYQLREFNGRIDSILNPRGENRFNRVNREQQVTRYLNVILQFLQINTVDQLSAEYNAPANNRRNNNNRKNNQ
jgi:serine/threonine protein kinase